MGLAGEAGGLLASCAFGGEESEGAWVSMEVELPPATPSTPSGPSSGYRWASLTYTTSTTDPDNDRIQYQFDWGDGSTIWTDYYASEQTASASHSWNNIGSYVVRARAKDTTGLYSGWSPNKIVNIIRNPANPCPTLFVWNGSEYVEEGVLDIHGNSDITVMYCIETLVPDGYFCELSLKELDEFTSHIDYVKLYAVDSNAEKHPCFLIQAIHSKLGHVEGLLLFDDGRRVDLPPSETIDLRFIAPYSEIDYFIFEINGYNIKA